MILSFGPSAFRSMLLLAASFLLLTNQGLHSSAFVPQPFGLDINKQYSAPFLVVERNTQQLWSTPSSSSSSSGGGGGGLDDDEISKLIGRRNQIKRKKKEEPEEEKLPDDVVSFDLGSLPEFKTARPVRKSKKEQEEEQAAEAAAQRQDDGEISSIDHCSEYADENELHIPNRLGFSTAGWGDPAKGFVAEGKLTKRMIKAGMYVPGDCQMVYNKLLEGGISLVETSSVYGKVSRKSKLSAEEILAQCVAEYQADGNQPLIVNSLPATWVPLGASGMKKKVEQSCQRLKMDAVDVVQASKKIPFLSRILANGLMQVVEAGSCNYVGVVGIVQRSSLKRFAESVERQGGVLTSNAFEFSLSNPKHEAMIEHCKELGVIPLILNPLDGGLASGVYTATNPSGGEVGTAKFQFERLEKLQPLHSVQETVAERVRTRVAREQRDMKDRYRSRYGPPPKVNTDITTTQIAINYVVAKGGVPLPDINTPKQADELLGCLGWRLTDDEVDMLDSAAALCQL